MFRLKLTTLVLLVVAFLSLPIFALAQTNPTIEVCSGTCYPTVPPNNLATSVYNQILVNHDDGSIPGDLTYKRGSTIRIHSNVSDPGGVSYVKAIIEDALGNQLVIIPLFNDGASSHGDEAGLLNGSPTGITDDVYSNLWIAPFKLQTGVPYYLHIEAADSFAKDSTDVLHIYKTDLYRTIPGNELEFYLTDACLATCGTLDEYRCSKGVREKCVFDPVNSCNSWKSSSACATGICCGANSMTELAIGCCPTGANFCDTSTYTCLTCDNTCNNSCSNTACPISLDPDCGSAGCCGDGTCNAGENPGTCNADCPDTGVPTIVITNPADGGSIPENAFFMIEANITDDWNPIASLPIPSPSPSAMITMGSDSYGPFLLSPIGGGKFRSAPIDALATGFNTGVHTLTITASDIVGNTASNHIDFTIICASECSPSSYPICDGNDKKECSIGGDGCYDITPVTTCTTLFGGKGLCKNNSCCEENCNIGTYTPTCADDSHLNACIPQTDGCNRAESNLDCKAYLSNTAAVCRTATSPTTKDGCCIDACTPGPATCNATGNAIQNCVIDSSTGCYILQDTACTIPQVCKNPTGPAPAGCCANDCSPLGTKIACGGTGDVFSMNCSVGSDGCFDISPNEDCSALGAGWDCRRDTSAGDYDCCKDECSLTDAPNCLTATTLANCNPTVGDDGCYNNTVTNCVTALGAGATCETNSSGIEGCCLNTCTTIGEKRCNAGKVETCSEVASGCNNYVVTQDCTATSGTCKDTGSGGATCCNDSCSAVKSAFACGSTDNKFVLNCNLDSFTGCFYTTNGADCHGGPLDSCGINSYGSANCCTHNCTPGSKTCSSTTEELFTCDTIESDGCSGTSSVNCAATGDVCRTGDAGAGCCKDLCVSGSPTVCTADKKGFQACGTTSSGCTGLGAVTLCPATEVCYNGANPLTDNAFCALPDNTPPVVTITSPLPTTESWVEDSSDDFNSASSFANTAVYSDSSSNASVLLSSIPNVVGAPWEQIIPGAIGGISVGGDMTYNQNTNLYYVLRGQSSPAIYSYSPSSGIWGTLTSVPLWHFAQRIGVGSAIHYPRSGNFLYVVAGEFTSGGMQKARFHGYNISTGAWDATIPFALPEGKSSAYGSDLISTGANDLYFSPGINSGTTPALDANEFYHYNVGAKNWTVLADLPAPYKWNPSSNLVYDGSANIYGLVRDTSGTSQPYKLIRYNIADGNWHDDVLNSITSVFAAGYGADMVYVPGSTNYIYLLGSGTLARYPLGIGGWEEKSSPLAVASFGGSFVYPGSGNLFYSLIGNNSTDFYSYDMSADIASTLDWSPRASFTGTSPLNSYSSVYAQKYDKIYTYSREFDFLSYSTNSNLWGVESGSNLFFNNQDGGLAYDGNDYLFSFEDGKIKRFNIASPGWTGFLNGGSILPHSLKSLVFCNNNLYVIGGGGTTTITRGTFSGTQVFWNNMATVPGDSRASVSVGNYIYVLTSSSLANFKFARFNALTNLVETSSLTLPPTSIEIAKLTYPGSGDYIYATGGTWPYGTSGSFYWSNELYRYSISTDKWSLVSFMPKDYASFLTATVSGNIYFTAGDNTFYRYNVLTYNTPGNYVSSIHDTKGNLRYGTIDWDQSLNDGNITVKVRSCDDAACSGEPAINSCATVTNGADISGGCVVDGHQYIQYRVDMSTTDTGTSPALNRIEIQYDKLPKFTPGDFITIKADITDTGTGVSTVFSPRVYLQNPDDNMAIYLTLFDDTTHGDLIPNNGKYGTDPWNSTAQTQGKYFLDIEARDVALNSTFTPIKTGNNVGAFMLTDPCGGATDVSYGSESYNIKGFGSQCWFTENINVGIMINPADAGMTPTPPTDPFNYSSIQKYCYLNSSANCTTYGALYNWTEANGLNNICLTTNCSIPTENQGICPVGWHIPNDSDWFVLKSLYATSLCTIASSGCPPSGTELKVGGSSGFNALLSGTINQFGNELYLNSGGFYWNATPYSVTPDTHAYSSDFSLSSNVVSRTPNNKKAGMSVRCVKN